MELEFYGATERVTGSCHIIRTKQATILLDCGLIQGSSDEEQLNRAAFPFDPASIDVVVLSHGHIDHSGRLPLLVQRGFSGSIYTHEATLDLCRVLLLDSASLAERDAEYQRKHPVTRQDKHAEPLYTRKEVLRTLDRMVGIPYHRQAEIVRGITLRLSDAGHILGSSLIELWIRDEGYERKLVFSGDLGQYASPVLQDPETIEEADLVIVESTYGDRLHRDFEETALELGTIIRSACRGCGNILIPAFAIGRSQELLYLFALNYKEWQLDRWQIFLDSPMAIEASQIYWDYPELVDVDARDFREHPEKLPPLGNLHFTPKPEQSRAINSLKSGAVIIAGSGMCNGGRILHHLKQNIHRHECKVIITGYQAEGTLGRKLVDGDKEVSIHGRNYAVAATVHTVGGLSAHGDQEDMLRWLGGFRSRPKVFVVHGDGDVKKVFKAKIEERFDLNVTIPESGSCVNLLQR
ncbi:MBL fold metallo-hydrolase RNA specificity domain-containing protein [Chlorobium phaeobacteroides]|jgi:metallo-beta-lactamase family protein|uniref:Beta-lactamase domain protein n=1 Tax=Chlorobium phaeobacteroides (strain DSM 266 / SMG 266 / 2430) TaxID=290317 RepID=A1BHB2_CHLPD|nr:MBL fold metallo-hydrolase [Chlorobium phaeobacteroides]ABL65789.1 beta-lactamase domain protein [Chlorobium phaeobacteroides DSM 266]MBV5326084.1 MBL fold metallo-hydrolase [Chlorobium sp.]